MTVTQSLPKTLAITLLAGALPFMAVAPNQAEAQQRTPQRTVEQQQVQTEVPTGPAVFQSTPNTPEPYTCSGYIDCNNAISDCIAAEGDFEATKHDDDGGVIGGTCTH